MVIRISRSIGEFLDQVSDLMSVLDPLSAAVSLLIFWRVGSAAVERSQTLRRVGLGIGLIGFCAFLIRSWLAAPIDSGFALANTTVRALFCAGFSTSVAWIVLAITAFLYHEVIQATGILRRED